MSELGMVIAESKDLTPGKKVTLSALVKTTIEVADYIRKSKEENKLYPAGAVSLVGIKAAFPERFEGKSLDERDNIQFFSVMAILGVAVNDVVDIVPKMREQGGQQEVIEKTFRLWRKARSLVKEQVNRDPQKSKERNDLVQGYQREVLFLEKQARLHTNKWSLEEIIHYRKLVNAVGLVHSAAAILPYPDIGEHAKPVPKHEISFGSLAKKYEWLTDNKPRTEAERRLATLFNLVMAAQVVDDWHDIEDDRKLNIASIGTVLVDSSESHKTVEHKMRQVRDSFLRKAMDSGSTRFASIGVVGFFSLIKELQRRFPKNFGGIRENLLNSEAFFMETNY